MTDIRNTPTTNNDSAAADAPQGTPTAASVSLPETIATRRFALGRSVHARMALSRRSVAFWFAVALPLAALVVGGLYYDNRLLFIAAVLVFILYPTLLFIAWHSILTRRWAVDSIFPQIVTLNSDDEICVEYFPMVVRERKMAGQQDKEEPARVGIADDKEDTDKEEEKKGRLEEEEMVERTVAPPAELVILPRQVADCRIWGDYVAVTYDGNRELLVPLSAFPSQQAAASFLERVSPRGLH